MPTQKQNIIPIQGFNFGGIADSRWGGAENTLFKLIGFDLHSKPGILKVAQKLSKHSGTIIDEFCKESITSTNGIKYWFSSESGKVWQDKNGTITLVYTTVPAAGEAKCLGAAEYQGVIYWATESRIHRIIAANADGAVNWGINAVLNWATFSITDAEFHPMVEQNLVLYIGDGNYVAQVDAGVFSPDALDIKTPLRVKSVGKIFTDILIGTFVDDNVNKTTLFRWNTWSASFQVSNEINEVGINAILSADTFVVVQAGRAGRLYLYDYGSNSLTPYKVIPGNFNSHQYAIVHPSAVGIFNGNILFGLSHALRKVDQIADDFNDNEIDRQLWQDIVEVGDAEVTEENQQLKITLPENSTAATKGLIGTQAVNDLTGNGVFLKPSEVPSAITNAKAVFFVYETNNKWFAWEYENGTLSGKYQDEGAITTVATLTYDSAVHVYWKIREENGTVYWDTSVDGETWTNRGSFVNTNIVLTNMGVQIQGYCYQAETDPGNFIIDSFNLIREKMGLQDSIDLGVYSIGRHSQDYPFVLDLPYPISERITTDDGEELVLSGLEIGSILISGFDIFVSWKRGSAKGVDKLNYSEKLNGAYFETRVMRQNRAMFTNFSKILIAYFLLPTATDILIYYSRNYAAYLLTTTKDDVDRDILYTEEGFDGTTLQVKVKTTARENDAPEIESGGVELI